VQEASFHIAALLHQRRLQADYFKGTCIHFKSDVAAHSCEIKPEEVLFVRWSGQALGAKDYICSKGIAMSESNREAVQTLTLALAAAVSPGVVLPVQLKPILPEAVTGWLIYEEYNRELAVRPKSVGSLQVQPEVVSNKSKSKSKSKKAPILAYSAPLPKVCFLVSVDAAHDSAAKVLEENSIYSPVFVQDMIQSK